jgi:hypothetical protein
MKNKLMLILSVVLVCISLYFLINTINIYSIEQRISEEIESAIYPDTLIYTENGSLITNPEIKRYEIEMDLNFEILEMSREQFRENRNILLVFIFLTIISFKIFLEKK